MAKSNKKARYFSQKLSFENSLSFARQAVRCDPNILGGHSLQSVKMKAYASGAPTLPSSTDQLTDVEFTVGRVSVVGRNLQCRISRVAHHRNASELQIRTKQRVRRPFPGVTSRQLVCRRASFDFFVFNKTFSGR